MTPIRRFWLRHRTLFWSLHSVWAFASGVVVVFLARERYGFVPWVVLFLALTWASSLFFGRRLGAVDSEGVAHSAPTASAEIASYVTRTLYQETLFFLLPFYAYSTVVASPNILFTALLAGLAAFSCLDLPFDKLLRRNPLFGLVFFSTVTFAAVNLLLPILLPLDPQIGTGLATLIAVVAAIPLALQSGLPSRKVKLQLVVGAAAFATVVTVFPILVPPVPLRLDSVVFSSELDRASLTPADSLANGAAVADLNGSLFVLLTVFAPSDVPTAVSLEWAVDGEPLRTSRDIAITAHQGGFRIWDAWRPTAGALEPGVYRVVVRTGNGRVFGEASIRVS